MEGYDMKFLVLIGSSRFCRCNPQGLWLKILPLRNHYAVTPVNKIIQRWVIAR